MVRLRDIKTTQSDEPHICTTFDRPNNGSATHVGSASSSKTIFSHPLPAGAHLVMYTPYRPDSNGINAHAFCLFLSLDMNASSPSS